MEQLYKTFKNKNTPIAKSLKKLIRDMKRNKPTKSAAKKGGSPTKPETQETQQTLRELVDEKKKLSDILALLQENKNSPTGQENTPPNVPNVPNVSKRTNTAKTGNPKSNGNGTRSRTTKDSSAGRFANVQKQAAQRMMEAWEKSKGLPKGGRKTKKKRKHKRKTKKNNILKK